MSKAKVFNLKLLLIVPFIQLSQSVYQHKRCYLDNSACLTEQAQKILKEFVNGDSKQGYATLDKLSVDPVIVDNDNFAFNWTDMIVSGLKDAVIDQVSIDTELKTMRLLFHANLLLEFDSEMEGVMLSVLPLERSHGRGELDFTNLQMELFFLFDIVKDVNGNDFMDLKKYYYGYNSDRVVSRFENLYNGDKEKSDRFHKLVNQNWRTMVHNYAIFFQRKITGKIFDAVKVFMRSQPLEELALYGNNNDK